jgi:Peptidase A4 family
MAQQVEFHGDENFHTKLPFIVTPAKIKGVYLNPTPPDDLDINKATQDELTKYGLLWRKPTDSSPPYIQNLLDHAFSRKWESKNRIVPEFEPQPGRTHHLKDNPVKRSDNTYVSRAWSGASKNTGKWLSVIGTWTIPVVSKPNEPQGNEGGWNSSSWVGIDGMVGSNGVLTSNDVLQAGIEQKVSASGVSSYVAWYEWYAPPVPGSPPYIYQINITNFPVQPGNIVYCFVRYINNTAGYISFANETTGQTFSITLAPPPGASFNGGSCEWIMEAPDGGEPTSSLPSFTPLVFTGSMACGSGSNFVIPGNCDTITLEDASGKALTYTTVNSDTLTISYIG